MSLWYCSVISLFSTHERKNQQSNPLELQTSPKEPSNRSHEKTPVQTALEIARQQAPKPIKEVRWRNQTSQSFNYVLDFYFYSLSFFALQFPLAVLFSNCPFLSAWISEINLNYARNYDHNINTVWTLSKLKKRNLEIIKSISFNNKYYELMNFIILGARL